METVSLDALTAMDSLLSEDELMVRDTVRQFVAEKILPDIGRHFEEQTFPDELIPQIGALGLLGQVDHPTVVAAQERIIASAKAAGMPVGSGLPVDPAFARLQADRGVQWLQIGGDCGYMVRFAEDMAASVRSQLAG